MPSTIRADTPRNNCRKWCCHLEALDQQPCDHRRNCQNQNQDQYVVVAHVAPQE
jgi:hypothetical protein